MLLVRTIIFCLLCYQIGFAQYFNIEEGVVAYYPFNGNANDKSGNGNHGIVKGAQLTKDRFGNEASAYHFDGKQQVIRIPSHSKIDFTQKKVFSISLWFRPMDLNTGCILLKHYDYGVKWGSMRTPVTYYSGTNAGYNNSHHERWRSENWYHLVMVQSSSGIQLYVNGKKDAYIEKAHETQASEQDIFIGKHPYFWGGFLGDVDDILIYNRALVDTDAEMLYQIESMPLEISAPKPVEDLEPKLLSGTWQGIITQPDHDLYSNFAFWLNFQVDSKGTVKGFSRIEIPETKAYGVSKMEISLSQGAVNFRETQITQQKNVQGLDWCQKYGKLYYDEKQGTLSGKWYADNCQKGGEIVLHRTQTAFNHYDNRLSEFVSIEQMKQLLATKKSTSPSSKEIVTNEERPPLIQKLKLEPIKFSVNRATITQSSLSYLEQTLLPFLKEQPKVQLKVTGHTDSSGKDEYNLELSISRAKAIVDFLVKKGIAQNRLSYEGYGESQPIAANSTPAGREKNRRVEFEVSVI